MTFNLNFLPIHRSHQVLKSLWGMSSWCWSGSVTRGVPSASARGWLRQFLLLKLVTVLLFPLGAGISLLVGCMFSLRTRVLLCSPHVSTKPSSVFLGQLALSDSLVLLQWTLQLGASVGWRMAEVSCEVEMGLVKEGESLWWREAMSVLCQQLLDAHHLASLLLLGLLGLEATLVSHWPQETCRFRTSHWAQLSCSLVWILVLLELALSLHTKVLHHFKPQPYSLQDSQIINVGLGPPPSLPGFSACLRKALWLVNLWLHFVVLHSKPQRRESCFH